MILIRWCGSCSPLAWNSVDPGLAALSLLVHSSCGLAAAIWWWLPDLASTSLGVTLDLGPGDLPKRRLTSLIPVALISSAFSGEIEQAATSPSWMPAVYLGTCPSLHLSIFSKIITSTTHNWGLGLHRKQEQLPVALIQNCIVLGLLSLGFTLLPPFYRWGGWGQRGSIVIIHSHFILCWAELLSHHLPSPLSRMCQQRFKSININLESKAGISLCCHCQIKPFWLFLMLSAWERWGLSFFLLFEQK